MTLLLGSKPTSPASHAANWTVHVSLQVGKFDPVTRQPCTEAQVRPNLGLRSATQEYLDGHAWAWKDCV